MVEILLEKKELNTKKKNSSSQLETKSLSAILSCIQK